MFAEKKFECYCFELKKPPTGNLTSKNDDEIIFSEQQIKKAIRERVCQDLDKFGEVNGKEYCVLHYPKNTKNAIFVPLIKERIEKKQWYFSGVYFSVAFQSIDKNLNEKLIKKFEENHPDTILLWKNSILDSVDFSYSFFKGAVKFNNLKFNGSAKFDNAIFDNITSFDSSNFVGEADFSNCHFKKFSNQSGFLKTVFQSRTSFSNAEFYDRTTFREARFEKNCIFSRAKFFSTANFEEVRFCGHTKFEQSYFEEDTILKSAVFSAHTNFTNCFFKRFVNLKFAVFETKSRIFFDKTIFNEDADFTSSNIENFMFFNGGDGEYYNPKTKKYKKQSSQIFDKELILTNSQIEKPERIHFYKTRLLPHWFIKLDTRKIVFSESWENISGSNTLVDIKTELACFNKHKTEESKQLLKIVYCQLAENAENNNRFEEASNFRRMAFETEWLEKKERILNWIKNLIPESDKLKRRFSGSTNEEDKPSPPTNSFGILRRSGDFIIHGLYRITSFYGESWSWAAFVLAFIIFGIFPFIYTQTEFQVSPKTIPLEVVVKDCPEVAEELKSVCKIENRSLYFFREAIPHSLATASLQTVEYRIPKTPWGSVWMILEKIFAPLQAALLALAIRRKFMR